MPPWRWHLNGYQHELQICFDILTKYNIMSNISYGLDFLPGFFDGFPPQNGGRPGRSGVRDHFGAWARCARRLPQQFRPIVECGSRAAYRPVAADGVAA